MIEKITISNREINGLVARLKTFFNGNKEKTLSSIIKLIDENPNISKAEIFHKLSATKGKGKSHDSGAIEGQLKRDFVIRRKHRKRF